MIRTDLSMTAPTKLLFTASMIYRTDSVDEELKPLDNSSKYKAIHYPSMDECLLQSFPGIFPSVKLRIQQI